MNTLLLWRTASLATCGSLLALLAVAADAATIPGALSYDGTYQPNSGSPPLGQSQWLQVVGPNTSLTPNLPVGMATLSDGGTSTGERIAFHQTFTSAPFTTFAANPTNVEWEYSFRMQLNALGGPTSNNNLLFGMRDEGGNGKTILLGIDGGGGSPSTIGRLRFYNNAAASDATLSNYNFNDGVMHEYRVRKYLDPVDNQMKVRISVDGVQLGGPRLASSFFDDDNNTNGFGYFSPSPGTSNMTVDQVSLGPLGSPPTIVQPRFDGSYHPQSFNPPAGQTPFNTFNNIAEANMASSGGVLRLNDNSTTGRLSFHNPWSQDIQNLSWHFETRMKIDSLSGAAVTLGVRDENGQGRMALLGWSTSGELGFYNSSIAPVLSLSNYNFIDGLYHTYRVEKLWDGANFWMRVYIDGVALAPFLYSVLPLDLNADNGFGYYSSTPGLSDISIDYLNFAIVPEPSTYGLVGLALLLFPFAKRRGKKQHGTRAGERS